jgi:serine/threonine protein kinase
MPEGELQPGDSLGPYRLEELLGEGAMGIVYRAVRDGDTVALKVLKQRLSSDDVFRRRFEHEARIAAEVEHKHLVPILEAGQVDGRQYLASRYVPGRSLAQRIDDASPLPLEDVLALVADVASGLDALHRQGLVHRDVKPSNIVLDEHGLAALTDFGLAKGPAYTILTKPGQVMGTLDYLAPELIRGEEATPATDIYALGCVIFECLTGEPPFAGMSLFEVGSAHLSAEPPDPCARVPDPPPGLGWAAQRALAKDPGERPPTATAYASLLHVAVNVR